MVLVVLFVFSLGAAAAVAATNDSSQDTDFSIYIDNAWPGFTYTAYKIFDVTYSGDPKYSSSFIPSAPYPDKRSLHGAYAYSISNDSPWWTVITEGSTPNPETGVYEAHQLVFTPISEESGVVTYSITFSKKNVDAAELAKTLKAALENMESKPNHQGQAVGPDLAPTQGYSSGRTTVTIPVAGPGYYFIDTSAGSLCSLGTTEPQALIREKNSSLPTIKKEVFSICGFADSNEESASGVWDKSGQSQIGDDIPFMLRINDIGDCDGEITV